MSASPPSIQITLPHSALQHFNLYYYTAVLDLMEPLSAFYGSFEAALNEFPFLQDYLGTLAEFGLTGQDFTRVRDDWFAALDAWESHAPPDLPLFGLLSAADLERQDLALLFTAGLEEEDPRFGDLFDALQGGSGQRRTTYGLLKQWWRSSTVASGSVPGPLPDNAALPAERLRRLLDVGLLEVLNPADARLEWVLAVPNLVWDMLRGAVGLGGRGPALLGPGMRYIPPTALLALEDLLISPAARQAVEGLRPLLADGSIPALVVRGPRQNGRHSLLGALARQAGRGVLALDGLEFQQRAAGEVQGTDLGRLSRSWRLAGLAATLLQAMPVIDYDLTPGQTVEVPRLPGYAGPLGLALPNHGGIRGAGVDRALTITLEIPGSDRRRLLWQRALAAVNPSRALLESLARQFRLTSGNIHRAADLARSYAALRSRGPGFEQRKPGSAEPAPVTVTLADVQDACRALNRQALDTLATYVPAIAQPGEPPALVVSAEVRQELDLLEVRCRERERLREAVNLAAAFQVNAGVRALFSGPSGTGKTLAARMLAGALHMDLYRLDLAAVVNKYIGETEKSLNQVFARAEELDVILLLDEGDALLTQRTHVHSSNDRYANLETNYLLQRLETFEGILIITTNAAERIDPAFERRMDVNIHFPAPDIEERWGIWQIHLPRQHAVDSGFLAEVVERCEMTGGQIRNAALFAALLSLRAQESGPAGALTTDVLEAAVRREYRKTGAICPLRERRSRVGAGLH